MKIIRKRGEITRVLFSKEEKEQVKEKDKGLKVNPFTGTVQDFLKQFKTQEERRDFILEKALNSNMKLSEMIDFCRISENFNKTEALRIAEFINNHVERFASQSRKFDRRFEDHCSKNSREVTRVKRRDLSKYL